MMTERAALSVFWTFMLLCAGTALVLIWGGDVLPQKLVPTFFIIGLAAFLIWAPLLAYRFLTKLDRRS
jgi:tryptophan-rich sensory protein